MKIDSHPDRTGSAPSETRKAEALAGQLRALDTQALAAFLHTHEDDESSPEFKAVMAEIYRRDAIYQGKHLTDLGEQA